MKHFTPINLFSVVPDKAAPQFSCQREVIPCYQCGHTTMVAVKSEYIDYHSVADQYKTSLERLMNRFSGIMQDMELLYGNDNPAAVHYRNEIAMLILETRRRFGVNERGSSAGMGSAQDS